MDPISSFAFSAEALVGRALGARARAALRRAAWLSSFWGGVVCVGFAIVFALFLGGTPFLGWSRVKKDIAPIFGATVAVTALGLVIGAGLLSLAFMGFAGLGGSHA